MSNKKNYAIIVGARPNFVKAVPLLRRVADYPNIHFSLVHTGQHFDQNMSKVFFDQMKMQRPDIMLDIKATYHTEKIGKMFNALDKVFSENHFDGAIVVGDVNSTLAGALAAVKNKCHLIHIEAGLRSHDRRMPEEINRVIIDHLSEQLFTTEPQAEKNLLLEGISPDKIKYVGNLMIESLEIFAPQIAESDILSKLDLRPKEYAVVTIHRQENTDDPTILKNILYFLNQINRQIPLVLPLHPGTKKIIEHNKLGHILRGIKVIEPQGYFDFLKLVPDSRGVITDSGGIQEETTHLGIPCCTLRDNTERPITLEMGSNMLIPLNSLEPDKAVNHLKRTDFKSKHIPLWDDKVSQRIFKWL